jgi:hypothetical protein
MYTYIYLEVKEKKGDDDDPLSPQTPEAQAKFNSILQMAQESAQLYLASYDRTG